MDAELKKYITSKCEAIISCQFRKDIHFVIDTHKEFLTEEVLKSIYDYKKQGCISPDIFNLVYFYLRDNSAYSRDFIIKTLKPLVKEQFEQYLKNASESIKGQINQDSKNDNKVKNSKDELSRGCLYDEPDYSKRHYPDYWPKYFRGPYGD